MSSLSIMSSYKDLQTKLQMLGLSLNQATIYLLLIEYGNLRIQEISKLAHIPRSSVYENLSALRDLGLIEEIVQDNFKLIRPYPLTAMEYGLHEKISKLQKQSNSLSQVEKALSTVSGQHTSSSPMTIRYYKGVAGARQLFWNTLKATDTVCVYSAFGRSKFLGVKYYENFVSESAARGIKELVLINPTERALGLIKRDTGSSLARTSPSNIYTLDEIHISIKGETFIYGDIYANVYLDDNEIHGFEIESRHFAETQRSIFKTLLNIATPLT